MFKKRIAVLLIISACLLAAWRSEAKGDPNLPDAKRFEKAYDYILRGIGREYPEAMIQGVSVQKMARPGVEVIVGMSKDAQFGPVIMFGLGGILVEILKTFPSELYH